MAPMSNADVRPSPDEQQPQQQPEQLNQPQMSAQQQQMMIILLARMRQMSLDANGVRTGGAEELHMPQQQQHPGVHYPNQQQQDSAQQTRNGTTPNGHQQPVEAAYNPDESLARAQLALGGITTNGFDPSALFRPDGDIDFERDFGQWFNPDDSGTALRMEDLNLNDNGSPPAPATNGQRESPTGNPPAPNGRHQQAQRQQLGPLPNHLNTMTSASTPGMQSSSGGMGPDTNLLDATFLDEWGDFDPSALFRPDGDINFERDFGQWFTPDDNALGAGLDMK